MSCLPFFCGLSSQESSSKGQRMVAQFLDGLSGGMASSGGTRSRDPDFYLNALQKVWLESQQAWLNGVYEGRLKNISIYPPPGDKQIVLALEALRLHDLIPLVRRIRQSAKMYHNSWGNRVQNGGLCCSLFRNIIECFAF